MVHQWDPLGHFWKFARNPRSPLGIHWEGWLSDKYCRPRVTHDYQQLNDPGLSNELAEIMHEEEKGSPITAAKAIYLAYMSRVSDRDITTQDSMVEGEQGGLATEAN